MALLKEIATEKPTDAGTLKAAELLNNGLAQMAFGLANGIAPGPGWDGVGVQDFSVPGKSLAVRKGGEADEAPKAEKKQKGGPKKEKSDAQKKQEFLQNADLTPAEKKRIQKMAPGEFDAMLAAISDEDEDEGGKTAFGADCRQEELPYLCGDGEGSEEGGGCHRQGQGGEDSPQAESREEGR